jgi:hypothetical protein
MMKKFLACLIILLMLGGVFSIAMPTIAHADPLEDGIMPPQPPPVPPDD